MSGPTELLRLLRGRLPSEAALEAIRVRRLRALVRSACEHVPYYRELFAAAGVQPDDIRRVEDLRHVPISTRDGLQAAGPEGLAHGVDLAAGEVVHTSGSTGKPLGVFRTRHEERLRRATEFRSMRWAGVRSRDRIASIGPSREVARPLQQRLGFYRTIVISPLLPADQQIRRLREVQPTVLWAYPTALRALLQQGGPLEAVVRPRLMIHSAEPLDEVLRREVRAGLAIETRNFYGSVESGRIGWECSAQEGLHVNADCVIVELVDEVEVPGAGQSVVITNLNSHAMPFIRYRLGDRCELAERPCSCGAPFPLMKPPAGRDWDLIQLPSGKLLSPYGFNIFLRGMGKLQQFRLVQKRLDWLVLQLRFGGPPEPGSLEALRGQFERHLGEPVRLEMQLVDTIEEGSLKFRSFISEVSPPLNPALIRRFSKGRSSTEH